jgi:hypothetical protein
MWKAQVLAAVRGARLEGHLTGSTPAPAVEIDSKDGAGKDIKIVNPLYEEWFATDQQILSFILGSLTREILSQVVAKEKAADLWAAIEEICSLRRIEPERLILASPSQLQRRETRRLPSSSAR